MRIAVRRLARLAACFTPLIITSAGRAVILYGTSTTASEIGKHMVVIGRGTQRGDEVRVNGVLKGWQWGAADLVQSWGENTISDTPKGNAEQGDFVAFDFTAGATNEGILSAF